jgi:hypothetical protein
MYWNGQVRRSFRKLRRLNIQHVLLLQVVKNVVHVTISGVFATHYFLFGGQGVPSNPTLQSSKRAMTTSFGSICYGSLIIALVRTIKSLVESAGRDSGSAVGAILACCLACILSMFIILILTASFDSFFSFLSFSQRLHR